METTSKDLCKLPPTDAIIIDQQHTAIFAGTTSTMNVFQWDNVKAEISTFSFNATVESTWNLINIFGEEVELSQISFKLKGAIEKRKILFNFCKATNSKLYTIHPGFLADPINASRTKNNYDFIWDNNNSNTN